MKSFKTPQTRTSKTKLPDRSFWRVTHGAPSTAEYVREFNRLNQYSNSGEF